MKLLEDLIGKDQMTVYKRTGRVIVKGEKYDWLIERRKKWGAESFEPFDEVQVYRLEKGKMIDLCIAQKQQHELPATDKVVGYALMAKANEDLLQREANEFGSRPWEEKEAAVL